MNMSASTIPAIKQGKTTHFSHPTTKNFTYCSLVSRTKGNKRVEVSAEEVDCERCHNLLERREKNPKIRLPLHLCSGSCEETENKWEEQKKEVDNGNQYRML